MPLGLMIESLTVVLSPGAARSSRVFALAERTLRAQPLMAG